MPSPASCAKPALLIAVALLSACASVTADDLYRPNFGRNLLPHFDASADPDPMAVTNGLYASPSLHDPCYLCSPQSRFNAPTWAP